MGKGTEERKTDGQTEEGRKKRRWRRQRERGKGGRKLHW